MRNLAEEFGERGEDKLLLGLKQQHKYILDVILNGVISAVSGLNNSVVRRSLGR